MVDGSGNYSVKIKQGTYYVCTHKPITDHRLLITGFYSTVTDFAKFRG